MAIDIVIPRLGWSMDEGTFVEWLKKDGQWVQAGEMLFVLEGDKVTQEIESFDSGFLHISPGAPRAGETVAVGQVLGYLVAQGEPAPFEVGIHHEARETIESGGSGGSVALVSDAATAVRPQKLAPSAADIAERPGKSVLTRSDRTVITPRARRAARELGTDWTRVQGTGRNGRIRERDIRAARSSES